MSSSAVITSMSLDGFRAYGQRAIETFTANSSRPMVVYADHPVACAPARLRLTSDISPWVAMRAHWKAAPPQPPHDAAKPKNYIWDVQRFAVKPFVWYDAASRMGDGLLVWIDADTVTTQPLRPYLFEDCLRDSAVAYLGRGTMHPETGFVAFRLPDAMPLLFWMREMVLTGGYRALKDGWTDCHLLKAGLAALPIKARDLTGHLHHGWTSRIDAMALSPLGPYLTHLKGGKKRQAVAA